MSVPLLTGLRRALPNLVVPSALTGAVHYLQVTGRFVLFPVPPPIEAEYGNLALLLGCIAALVATQRFAKDRNDFGLQLLLPTALGLVLALVPYLLLRHGRALPLSPQHFAVVATAAYFVLYTLLGVLFGGAWTTLVKLLRAERAPQALGRVDPLRGRLD